jgi:hypothetical protein
VIRCWLCAQGTWRELHIPFSIVTIGTGVIAWAILMCGYRTVEAETARATLIASTTVGHTNAPKFDGTVLM